MPTPCSFSRLRLFLAAISAATSSALAHEPAPPSSKTDAAVENQSTPPPAHDPESTDLADLHDPYHTDWSIHIEPLMWYLSPSGDLRLPARSGSGGPSGGGFPNSGDSVDIAELNLDCPQFSPAGEVHFSVDRFRFTFSAASFSLDRDQSPADESFRLGAVPVAVGDELAVDFEFTTVELTAGYNIYSANLFDNTKPQRRQFATPFLIRTYLIAGARLYDTDFSLRNNTSALSADSDEFFIEPVLGARVELDINRFLSIDLQSSVGYFSDSDHSSASFDLAVGFHYHATENLGILIGWRQLLFDLSNGDGLDEFEFTGGFAGLYTGISLRF